MDDIAYIHFHTLFIFFLSNAKSRIATVCDYILREDPLKITFDKIAWWSNPPWNYSYK